jgi:hypothetical protein
MANVRVQLFASTARFQLRSMGERTSGQAGQRWSGWGESQHASKRREWVVHAPASGWVHCVPIFLPARGHVDDLMTDGLLHAMLGVMRGASACAGEGCPICHHRAREAADSRRYG